MGWSILNCSISACRALNCALFLHLETKSSGVRGTLASKPVRMTRSAGAVSGGEKVWRSLARRTLEAKVDEILLGFVGSTKEYLAAFIQDGSLIEKIIGTLRRLIDGYADCAAKQFCLETQISAEFYGIGRVETACRVIPALQGSARESCLANRETLTLATGDPADEIVAYTGIGSVRNTKHGHNNISKVVRELGPS